MTGPRTANAARCFQMNLHLMRRRDLLGGVIVGAALAPVLARAQKAMPVVGYLSVTRAPSSRTRLLAAFARD